MHKEECENKYCLDIKECEECPYHFKCDIENDAWNDILYGDD